MPTNNWTRYFELASRYYVFLILNIYGWAKMTGHQFFRPGHFPAEVAAIPLAKATGFQLAWAFFGYSTPYILFIGLAQVVGAWLLLWDKSKLIGIAILLPVLLNIIMVDLAYQISFGAMAVAGMCLFLLVLVLVWNQSTLRTVFSLLFQTSTSAPHTLKERGIALIIMVGLLGFYFGLLHLLGQIK
ncbi:hypothetical protein ACFPMF_22095 [Larkinella bovis]|uniref:DoxX family membrane protein n=1 Tax=Larkinella bovis TaxID=683041 RepID=A0ABW0IIM5_9BACT